MITPVSPPDERIADRAQASPRRRPVRILWLIKGLGPGGAEHLLTTFARRRDRARFSVRAAYLLPHKDLLVGALRDQGVPVECLYAPRPSDLGWLWRLRRSLLRDPVDVVHAHSPLAAVGARLVLRTLPRSRRPGMVTTDHSTWTGHVAPMRWADALTCRLDDAHLAVSCAVRDSMPVSLRRRTEVVVHGVDVEEVRVHRSERDAVRAELGLPPGALVVCTVANLRPVKAYPDLLDAARTVVAKLPGARFVAAGQGPQEAEVQALHAQLQLGDSMLLLGYRPDAVRLMAGCDVFCLPSLHEGLPVALMEALALGLPVVASRVGGILEVVDSGREGLLVAPGRPDELATALIEVLTDDRRRAVMATAAAARGATLSIGAAIERTQRVYEGVAAV